MGKKAIIIGAGPAGLTAAYEFIEKTDIHPIVIEQHNTVGGISRTIVYKGNRMDIGGHRFFSKNKEVTDFWNRIMPLQGAPSKDDILLNRSIELNPNGPDPEKEDRVMLSRNRVSRIFYLKKFFDYPISVKWQTFANLGIKNTIIAGIGFIYSCIFPKKEDSLENFYINRFGRPLYEMFFENYTEKVWGIHPSMLSADWGAQRVKGLSIYELIKDVLSKKIRPKDSRHIETSLIESFIYPKYGPGQLWETVAKDIEKRGGEVRLEQTISGIHIIDNKVDYVDITHKDGTVSQESCDYLISSMPIKELIPAIKGIEIPNEIMKIATSLVYRDFITVGLLVKKLNLTNKSIIKTYKNRIPDTWIYIQEREVKIGRLQIFNNWSPYLVNDYENNIWIGLEYFASEGDVLWNMEKDDFIKMAIKELIEIDIIKDYTDVIDSTQVKVKKAYPSYIGSYYSLNKVVNFINDIGNLYCVGRNGQHRYNNMDHSMLTSMEVVKSIMANKKDKTAIWSVNTEEDYHESK
jgi:protoporphyrinogen oxidase